MAVAKVGWRAGYRHQSGDRRELCTLAFPRDLQGKRRSLMHTASRERGAMASVCPMIFRDDLILMNLQYSPRDDCRGYLPQNLQGVALAWAIPLFDRFALMKQWGDGCLSAVRKNFAAASATALKARDIHCAEKAHPVLEIGDMKPGGSMAFCGH
jgi:hypothetical protein